MVNFGPLTAEIGSGVLGTPPNFNGFHILAALLHALWYWASAKLCDVEQRAPPIFGRAAITLGIGPHSSLLQIYICIYVMHMKYTSGPTDVQTDRHTDTVITMPGGGGAKY